MRCTPSYTNHTEKTNDREEQNQYGWHQCVLRLKDAHETCLHANVTRSRMLITSMSVCTCFNVHLHFSSIRFFPSCTTLGTSQIAVVCALALEAGLHDHLVLCRVQRAVCCGCIGGRWRARIMIETSTVFIESAGLGHSNSRL